MTDNMMDMDGQGCEMSPTPLPAMPVVAMAYVPFQQFNSTYTPEKGLEMGTIFPELDKPFLGGRRK
ncbi:spore coat associated protein CotJA [Caproiciproducens sp. R2]|uniref:spore coat associated protein CotJA n=1 Tax=Caproiciproducens sp. R2 TaxID=3435187 RepID=UPI00403356A6